jgi:hypothetical protein
MSDAQHDTVQLLIPWYANGTLEQGGRQQVEDHVEDCEHCRELLDQALAQAGFARQVDPVAALADVHPLLLTQYAEDPGQLDDETVGWIRDRLEVSPLSREALERLREVGFFEEEMEAEEAPADLRQEKPRVSFGEWFASTFLQPVPAMAYLVLLVILLPAFWLLRGPVEPAGAPQVFTTGGDPTLRADGDAAPQPLEIVANRGPVILELETELAVADLDELGATFDVEIVRAGEPVWSMPLPRERFRARGAGTVVALTLDPGGFDLGETHEVVVRAAKPGDPIDGQPLFRRTVRFVAD